MITFPYKKWNPFVQLDWHDGIFMTGPIPATGSAAHIAAGVLAMPWIGLGTNKNNGDTILADGMPVVSQGHAPGHLLIPHLNLFPFTPVQPNLFIPFLILLSSNTCAMAAGSVVGPDGPLSVSIFQYVGLNSGCTDSTAQTKLPVKGMKNVPKGVPLAFSLIPNSIVVNWGTVNIGFTWGDLLNFIASTLLNYAVDKLFSSLQESLTLKLKPKLSELLPDSMVKNAWKNALGKMGLPKVARAANGRFTSIGQALVGKTDGVADLVIGPLWDATGLPQSVTVIDVKGPVSGAADDAAASLGEWVDGAAERIP